MNANTERTTYADLVAGLPKGKPENGVEELLEQLANGGLEGLARRIARAVEWERRQARKRA